MDLFAILDQIGVFRGYAGNYSNTRYPVCAITGERPLAVYWPHVEGNEVTGYRTRYQLSREVQGIRPLIGTLSALDLSIAPILTSTTFTPPFPQELQVSGWVPNAPPSAVYEPVVIGNGIQAYYVMYVAWFTVRTYRRNQMGVGGHAHRHGNQAAPAA